MKTIFESAVTLEEAAAVSLSKPYLPYQPCPEFSKPPKSGEIYPIEPLKVFDNVYWMGTRAVGVLVIDTGDGFIIIDSGSSDAEAAYIAESFARMGLDPAKIRLIVISHEHFDHYGGVPYFIRNVCPDVLLAISRTGWNLLQTVPTEFAFIEPRPEKADILVDDGLCLKLGDTRLFCVSTPGHSAGCLSFIFNSSLHGEELTVGVMGGSAVWPNFPEARMYQNSIEYFKLFTDLAGCNAFSAVHQREEVLDLVRDHWNKGTAHPWACTEDTFNEAYLQPFRNKVLNTIYSDFIQQYLMPNGKPEGSPLPSRKEQFLRIRKQQMSDHLSVCGHDCRIIRLLGHGKGGYSYLAECGNRNIVLKQIHHEPCDYYSFGNKIEAEYHDYGRLKEAGIRIPEMLAIDFEAERIMKEYIEGQTVFDLVRSGADTGIYLGQIRKMAEQAFSAGLNIDYFPTNFVVREGLLWYVDYECNPYSDEWNFENWGIKYWSDTDEFRAYLMQDHH